MMKSHEHYEQAIKAKRTDVENRIAEASKKGQFEVDVFLLNRELIQELRTNGYEVNSMNGVCRISWNK